MTELQQQHMHNVWNRRPSKSCGPDRYLGPLGSCLGAHTNEASGLITHRHAAALSQRGCQSARGSPPEPAVVRCQKWRQSGDSHAAQLIIQQLVMSPLEAVRSEAVLSWLSVRARGLLAAECAPCLLGVLQALWCRWQKSRQCKQIVSPVPAAIEQHQVHTAPKQQDILYVVAAAATTQLRKHARQQHVLCSKCVSCVLAASE